METRRINFISSCIVSWLSWVVIVVLLGVLVSAFGIVNIGALNSIVLKVFFTHKNGGNLAFYELFFNLIPQTVSISFERSMFFQSVHTDECHTHTDQSNSIFTNSVSVRVWGVCEARDRFRLFDERREVNKSAFSLEQKKKEKQRRIQG